MTAADLDAVDEHTLGRLQHVQNTVSVVLALFEPDAHGAQKIVGTSSSLNSIGS